MFRSSVACACLLGLLGCNTLFERGKNASEIPAGSLVPGPADTPSGPAGSLEQRKATLQARLAANPSNLEARVFLGKFFMKERRFEDVKKLYQEGLEIHPGDIDLLKGLGDSALFLKDTE